MYFKTEAIVLKKRNFSESDRLLTIFTRDFGKLTILAKGARRPGSRKAGHLELGNWCKVFVARGKNIDILTEVELKRAFGIADFREDKANKIYHVLEIIENLTVDHQKNPGAFILLVKFLKKIETDKNFNLLSIVFKIKLLAALGFFSSNSLKNSKAKRIFDILEKMDFEHIEGNVRLSKDSHLKLLLFLDSMIENITSSKLKTSRFLDGAV